VRRVVPPPDVVGETSLTRFPTGPTFDARAWLARQLAVRRDELDLAGAPLPADWSGGAVVRYSRAGIPIVRLTVSGPRAHPRSSLPSHRQVAARWSAGAASTRIGPRTTIER
jgi:hypothetical protein